MDVATLRIIDANLNRAGEGLRVLEEHVRLVLSDAVLCARVKRARHALAEVATAFGPALLSARDILGDVGTEISTASERTRTATGDVAAAAARRAAESMRCIEEYGKLVDPPVAARVERLRYEVYAIEQAVLVGGPRRRRLAGARLHVLVTEALCRGPWRTVCEAVIAGGADVLQLREKSLTDRELLNRAERLRELTTERDALLIVNDRADIARLAGADGVHVGRTDLSVAGVRQIVGPDLLVGTSTHSVAEARAAGAERPDYIAVGPMFASQTKSDLPVRGPDLLVEVAAATDLPVVAIGGITAGNVSALRSTGTLRVAVCQSVLGAADPATATRELKAMLLDRQDVGA